MSTADLEKRKLDLEQKLAEIKRLCDRTDVEKKIDEYTKQFESGTLLVFRTDVVNAFTDVKDLYVRERKRQCGNSSNLEQECIGSDVDREEIANKHQELLDAESDLVQAEYAFEISKDKAKCGCTGKCGTAKCGCYGKDVCGSKCGCYGRGCQRDWKQEEEQRTINKHKASSKVKKLKREIENGSNKDIDQLKDRVAGKNAKRRRAEAQDK